MTAEHLLDAMGLLDDELIQEAEAYTAPKRRRNYGAWTAWAASFAVVLALGYGLTHFGIGSGGGSAAPGQANSNMQGAPSASDIPSGGGSMNGGSAWAGDSSAAGGNGMPATQEPMDPALEETDGYPAAVVGDVVYRNTGEVIPLFPDGYDLQYDISWYDEKSGETISSPGLCYLMLEDGSIAVSWDFQQRDWMIFAPDLPLEP